VILDEYQRKTLNLDKDKQDRHQYGHRIPQTNSLELSGTGKSEGFAVTTAVAGIEIDDLLEIQADLESSIDGLFEQLDFQFEFNSKELASLN